MTRFTRRTFIVAMAALLPLATVQAAEISERTIKFAFQNNKGHPQEMGAQKFAELVGAKSGGKIKVKLFPGGQLGGDVQTISAVQGGTIEMSVLNSGILQSLSREFAVFDFPFLFANPAEADAVTDGAFGKGLHAKLAEKNLIGLGFWDLGFRNITNSKHPITKVEDIAGLKLRVIQSPIYVDMFSALGANPTPLAWPEVYSALEQKAVDGQENPNTTIRSAKLNEVQKHLAQTRHVYNPQSLIFSKKLWDKLSADEKKIIADAATEATAYERQVSRQQASEAIEELKKSGMQVTEIAPAELQRMRDKVKPVIDKYSAQVGPDTVKALYAEIAKVRK
ncbi:MAG: TRAP transporter substrate-binding protein [Zoogloea oleivorans]|jgi:tripartite ATP-independent transporter DctP family solute receptor|uniref:TRAP transporter substrate-binding protein n=1 Tax=Zoogloea oleivorans TaxID=1552750 RepID=A0A6C2CDZ2_9RHOO|nr:TRAP transporter substrate-binding protein [Zoogloea oleivorans]MBT9498279.1 TRAP transporter substrate-binding protein [Zoogloea sp.]MDY0037231.1 TRAP transporter substrate-binding protein [Zoogloea oleivorans]TYC51906.1 TRAP transporter substrate-binding protein [Zoogloea oleivorans]